MIIAVFYYFKHLRGRMRKMLNENIFKAYDIRGVYPDEVNEEVIEEVGKVLPSRIGKECVVIGYDIRKGSKELAGALKRVLEKSGVKQVIEIGLSTTPMFYFLVNKLNADGGVMITASHNPPEFNGCKIVEKNAIPISGTDILKLVKK